jgi:ABC-type lipoprotein export system ATPase subunit
MLRAAGLTKSYPTPSGGRLSVLAGVALEAKAGDLVVVTGPSGAGKSTLLAILGLLEDPDAGQIWFGDEKVTALGRSARSRARGRSIGFMFQSFLLLPSLTALDNVLLAARYVRGVDRRVRQRALELLAEVGLSGRLEHYPPELSGGEQQRVAYCRAVLNDPPLLLADEPTGNLDDDNGAIILAALKRRAQSGGAIVVVSHRHDVAERATSVFRLQSGRLERGLRWDAPAPGEAVRP